MKITLNKEEKGLIKKHHKIKLKLLCPEDYYGHYYIDFDNGDLCIMPKKRGLNSASNEGRMEITEDKINGTFEGFTPFQIKCSRGYVVGTYQHKENKICVSHAMCQGVFKDLMNYLVNKFKTNNVLIYNVMNLSTWHKLKGFEKITMEDPYFKEEVTCLKGLWK